MIPTILDYNFTASTLHSENPLPSWAWFTVSVLLFLSHTLDGIDGKQARRTNTSSPLGELFDHGCDSWSTVFIATTFYSAFGRNDDGFSIPISRMYVVLWTVFFVFHISHWEKYNTGVMNLPWSYDVAMLAGTALYLVNGLFGTDIWKVRLPGNQPVGPIFEVTVYILAYGVALPVALAHMVGAYRRGSNKQSGLWEAMRPMVSYTLCWVLCLVWIYLSPNDILEADTRSFFYLSGTLYANMSCRLIVAQMSNTRCELLNTLLLPLTTCILVIAFATPSKQVELGLVYTLMALVTLTHLHYVTCVITQMRHYLKINCFSTSPYSEGPARDHRLIPNDDLADMDDDDYDDDQEATSQ